MNAACYSRQVSLGKWEYHVIYKSHHLSCTLFSEQYRVSRVHREGSPPVGTEHLQYCYLTFSLTQANNAWPVYSTWHTDPQTGDTFNVTSHQGIPLKVVQISSSSRTICVASSIFNCSPPRLFDLVGIGLQVNVIACIKALHQSPYYMSLDKHRCKLRLDWCMKANF